MKENIEVFNIRYDLYVNAVERAKTALNIGVVRLFDKLKISAAHHYRILDKLNTGDKLTPRQKEVFRTIVQFREMTLEDIREYFKQKELGDTYADISDYSYLDTPKVEEQEEQEKQEENEEYDVPFDDTIIDHTFTETSKLKQTVVEYNNKKRTKEYIRKLEEAVKLLGELLCLNSNQSS